jgi:protein MAK11
MVRLIGHKKGVLSLSVHPSNRLAISTSKDGTMKMWNLIKGKCAFTNKLEKQAQVVLWSPAAKSYAMVFEKEIKVFDASNGNTLHSITNSTPIHSILFLKEDEIVSGDEEGQIKRWRFKEDKFHVSFAAHQKRVKALSFVPSQHKLNNKHIVSVSSDGSIKLWDIDSAQLLASVSTTARLTAVTCLQLSNPSSSSSTQSNNASSKDNNASSKSNNTAHPSPSAAKEKKQRKKQKLNK